MSLRKEWPPALGRLAGFLGFWVVLDGIDPAGLLIGLGAAAAAASTSLRLFPPSPGRFRILPLTLLRLHFIWGSVLAGGVAGALSPLESSCVKVSSPRLPPSGGHRGGSFFWRYAAVPGSLPVEVNDGVVLCTVWIRNSRRRVKWLTRVCRLLKAVRGAAGMPEFLLAAAGFVLAMVALGLIRILRGPKRADRMMAAQLLGTGGIGALLLAAGGGLPAAVDVALTLALLAAFASIVFVKSSGARELDGSKSKEEL